MTTRAADGPLPRHIMGARAVAAAPTYTITRDTTQATSDEVKDLRHEMGALKELVADLTVENRLLKKNTYGAGGDRE